jgi:hypothetical protein
MRKILATVLCASCALGACATTTGPATTGAPEPPDQFAPQAGDFLLGTGFDSALQFARSTCVEGTLATIGPASGQDVKFNLERVDTVESLQSAIGMSAEASIGIGMFSGDASLDYRRTVSLNSYSTYMLVKVSVLNPTQTIRNPSFNDAARLALAADAVRFRNLCGNLFVSSLSTGGEFTALISISSRSEQEKRELDTAVSASVGLYGSAKGKFSEAFRKATTGKHVKVDVLRRGGAGPLPDVSDPEKVLAYALEFPGAVTSGSGTSWAISVIASDYHRVPEYGAAGGTVRRSPELRTIARRIGVLYQNRASLVYVLGNEEQFPILDQRAVSRAINEVDRTIQTLRERGSGCSAGDAAACRAAIEARIPEFEPPNRVNWKPIDVNNCNSQFVASGAEGGGDVLEVRGSWSAWNAGNAPERWFNAVRGMNLAVYLRDRRTGTVTESDYPNHGIDVPAATDVYVKIRDADCADNRSDQLRAAVYAIPVWLRPHS